jgi:hypothetical protein
MWVRSRADARGERDITFFGLTLSTTTYSNQVHNAMHSKRGKTNEWNPVDVKVVFK